MTIRLYSTKDIMDWNSSGNTPGASTLTMGILKSDIPSGVYF